MDSLLYQICDKLNPTVCDSALVVVNITPVIVASYDNLGTVASGGTLVKPLFVNDTLNGVGNFDPTLVNITVTDAPNKGTASINPTTGQVTYTPNAGASGIDSLIYRICDKLNPTVCDTALVVVNITPVIDAVRDVAPPVLSGGSVTHPLIANDTLNGVGNFNPTLVNISTLDPADKGTASHQPDHGCGDLHADAGLLGSGQPAVQDLRQAQPDGLRLGLGGLHHHAGDRGQLRQPGHGGRRQQHHVFDSAQ